ATRLNKLLPTQHTTYSLNLMHQELVPTSKDKYPPTFKSTTYKRSGVKKAYTNLIQASSQVTNYLRQNNKEQIFSDTTTTATFAPFVATDGILLPSIRSHLRHVALQAQKHYQRRVPRLQHEVMCDHIFTPPLDGFGISGLQTYFKHGFCITWIHDEIL